MNNKSKPRVSSAVGVDWHTAVPYNEFMFTIVETAAFKRDADAIWTTDERVEFCAWLAANPEAGDVIPGADGCRKVRWSASNRGKRGGARVVYFQPAGRWRDRVAGHLYQGKAVTTAEQDDA